MDSLRNIEGKVRVILEKHPQTRNDDMLLYYFYCNKHATVPVGGLPFEMVMKNYKAFLIPCFESIRRARQKLQAKCPELGCSVSARRVRQKQQERYKAYSLNKKEG